MMKHIKKFNEAIIDYETDNIKQFYQEAIDLISANRTIKFEDLKSIGDKTNVEVVRYDTFMEDLPEEQRKKAPPRDVPAFGTVNNKTQNPRIIVNAPIIDKRLIDFIYHMLKHENIHVQQYQKKNIKTAGEFVGDVKNQKDYFSNKDEVMAFSQSISDMIMQQNPKDMNDAIRKLKLNPLYKDIRKNVDTEILQRYKKYIYLYLEKEFEK